MNVNKKRELQEAFTEGFKVVQKSGLLQGAKAIAKVVLDKANDTTKTPEQRLDDIIGFCEVSLRENN